jgi:hypothetical protein
MVIEALFSSATKAVNINPQFRPGVGRINHEADKHENSLRTVAKTR